MEGDGGQRRHGAPNYAGSYKPQLGVGIWLLAVGSLWVVLNMGMMSSELYFRKTTLAALKGLGRQRDKEAHAEVQKRRPRPGESVEVEISNWIRGVFWWENG